MNRLRLSLKVHIPDVFILWTYLYWIYLLAFHAAYGWKYTKDCSRLYEYLSWTWRVSKKWSSEEILRVTSSMPAVGASWNKLSSANSRFPFCSSFSSKQRSVTQACQVKPERRGKYILLHLTKRGEAAAAPYCRSTKSEAEDLFPAGTQLTKVQHISMNIHMTIYTHIADKTFVILTLVPSKAVQNRGPLMLICADICIVAPFISWAPKLSLPSSCPWIPGSSVPGTCHKTPVLTCSDGFHIVQWG